MRLLLPFRDVLKKCERMSFRLCVRCVWREELPMEDRFAGRASPVPGSGYDPVRTPWRGVLAESNVQWFATGYQPFCARNQETVNT